MAIEKLTTELIEQVKELAVQLTKLPCARLVVDYDREVDCLYLNFDRPQEATDNEMLDNGIIVGYKGQKKTGVTVLDASTR
ncbi:MAG: DUF2283 domain-containing protein [Dehalococcoidia bacterium]|nr:DUF2283 domain-containing protein [Dehalococcoidia bacterium]